MPSLRKRENIELGPRPIVRFWHSRMIRTCYYFSMQVRVAFKQSDLQSWRHYGRQGTETREGGG